MCTDFGKKKLDIDKLLTELINTAFLRVAVVTTHVALE